MNTDIIFLAFENNPASQLWRLETEDDFLEKEKKIPDSSTNKINDIRKDRPAILDKYNRIYSRAQNDETRAQVLLKKQGISDNDVRKYYDDLHKAKEIRQRAWIDELMKSVADEFEKAIKETKKGNSSSIIVAALPEFFWVDINDNDKHTQDITNYHKPLYSSVINDIFKNPDNAISKLTGEYDNLIFFAGTAMHKDINSANRAEEEVKNSLFIYHSGALQMEWGKRHFSRIDGFNGSASGQYYCIKNKKGEIKDTSNSEKPMLSFMNKTFAFDICLDFCFGKTAPNSNVGIPLSAQKIGSEPVDLNVLIAGGMPIYNNNNELENYAKAVSSRYILRCDAIAYKGCCCEFVDKINDEKGNLIDLSSKYQQNFNIIRYDMKI